MMLWCHIMVVQLHQNLEQKSFVFSVFLGLLPSLVLVFFSLWQPPASEQKAQRKVVPKLPAMKHASGADAEETLSSACMLGRNIEMDTLGFEPRAFRMRSGCDATTP